MTRDELIAKREWIRKTIPMGIARTIALREVEIAIGKIDRAAPRKPENPEAVRRECERIALEVMKTIRKGRTRK